jgi:hypothetical protein
MRSFTLEQQQDYSSDSDTYSEDEEAEAEQQAAKSMPQQRQQEWRLKYRLVQEEPLRVFGAGTGAGEDGEANNIVGVTLAGDGTVLVASKVINNK